MENLFHEFGHGLHSLLSRIHYKSLAVVPRDFVELPSQIMENWALEPEVLKTYAKHWKTGEIIPDTLIAQIKKAEKFNQGFATTEYLAASFLDMDWHTLQDASVTDAGAFEKKSFDQIGLLPQIPVRYRSPYFQHRLPLKQRWGKPPVCSSRDPGPEAPATSRPEACSTELQVYNWTPYKTFQAASPSGRQEREHLILKCGIERAAAQLFNWLASAIENLIVIPSHFVRCI